MTTTHTTTPPAPSEATDEVTDTGDVWSTAYAAVAGLLALVIGGTMGVAKLHNPWVFSLAFMIGLVSLWGFQHIKALNSRPINGVFLFITGIVALIMPGLGWLLGLAVRQPFWMPMVVIISVLGSAGFMVAIARLAPIATLLGILLFALTLVLMGQHSAIFHQDAQQQQQIQQQKQKDQKVIQDNCELFPAEPGCQ